MSEERREWMELVADLRKENERLKAELADRDAWHKAVLDETCGQDERHCTCVPLLRKEIDRLRDHNNRLWLYVAEQRCECYSEQGVQLPVECERCQLMRAAKAGGE